MCGIAGMIDFNGLDEAAAATLDRMVKTLHHRGPDEAGAAIHDNVAMGMRRLSIIDLAGGSQPIYNEDQTVWTVYNGEIYNFPELKEDLEARGHRFQTRTDTEVIVHAYESFGPDFPKRLDGMFAIALHDRKKRRFMLVRDHLGIKPLYYAYDGQQLVFGSELKALLASHRIPKELDVDALGEFLSWEYIPGQGTLMKSIRKLEPGHSIHLDLRSPRMAPVAYWDVPEGRGDVTSLSSRDWQDRIEAQVRRSTRMQMISDVPLGAFLSGGVDSSLIAACMGTAQTFSIGFDDPTYNELGWARQVADHLGVDHKDQIIRPDVADLFEHLMHFLDDPIGDFSIFPTFLVSQLARKYVTVALSGDGGDELFGGYETYLAQHKARQYERIPSVVRQFLIEPAVHRLPPTAKKKGLVNKAKRFVEGLAHPDGLAHARWRMFVGEALRQQLFMPEAVEKMETPPAAHIESLFKQAGSRGHLNRSLYVDVKSYLCDNILTKVDRMSMAVSLETRVPYLSPEVVALAFEVPERFKLRGDETKWILKKVAARHVPERCVFRPKEGFSIPIKHWLNTAFKPFVEELLAPRKIQSEGIFNHRTVARLIDEHRTNRSNHSHILWSLIVFQDWKKRWLEGTTGD
jgi:asparagine synthase (glutamine-hydrolysing)